MAMGSAVLLLTALLIDRMLGEPRPALHPVVWMGKYLQLCGRISTRCRPALAFLFGACLWWMGVALVFFLTWGLQALALRSLLRFPSMMHSPDVFAIVSLLLLFVVCAWLLKTTFSWRMLRDETLAVELALQQSLEAGRERLSMLVSRDTSQLSESEVRESAIESLAENLNDSVVAPIFWFLLFGLPGAAIYRFANTADAMWGYRGFRHGVQWEWAGKWAARADDALSWVPARITAILLLVATRDLSSFTRLRAEARKTPSPNSGWPMSALALTLDICLRKHGVYALNASGHLPEAADVDRAAALASRVIVIIVWSALLLAFFMASLAFIQ
ncbi:MAG: adenosylcobinamide-phosphate synthase CbiB [Pseudomonadota bacterium]